MLLCIDVKAKDLVEVPKKPQSTSTRKASRKVPSWHLTSKATMEYIMENDAKKEKECKKEEKYEKARKEAVAQVKKEERKAKPKVQKVTTLYKPALTGGKAPKPPKRVTKKLALDALVFDIPFKFEMGN